jgi:hypothetical protein
MDSSTSNLIGCMDTKARNKLGVNLFFGKTSQKTSLYIGICSWWSTWQHYGCVHFHPKVVSKPCWQVLAHLYVSDPHEKHCFDAKKGGYQEKQPLFDDHPKWWVC